MLTASILYQVCDGYARGGAACLAHDVLIALRRPITAMMRVKGHPMVKKVADVVVTGNRFISDLERVPFPQGQSLLVLCVARTVNAAQQGTAPVFCSEYPINVYFSPKYK